MATTSARIEAIPDTYSITVYLSGLDTNYATAGRTVEWYLRTPSGSYTKTATGSIAAHAGTGGNAIFTGLQPNTTYQISCTIILPGSGDKVYPVQNLVTVTTLEEENTRPDDWVWTYVRVGQNMSFPASEWNDFTARINEFRAYKSKSAYSFTTARAGTDINSSIVGQAVTAINDMSPPTRASSAVVGVTDYNTAYFNSLARALNSIS